MFRINEGIRMNRHLFRENGSVLINDRPIQLLLFFHCHQWNEWYYWNPCKTLSKEKNSLELLSKEEYVLNEIRAYLNETSSHINIICQSIRYKIHIGVFFLILLSPRLGLPTIEVHINGNV